MAFVEAQTPRRFGARLRGWLNQVSRSSPQPTARRPTEPRVGRDVAAHVQTRKFSGENAFAVAPRQAKLFG